MNWVEQFHVVFILLAAMERTRNHSPICSLILGRSTNVPQSKSTQNRRIIPRIFLNRNVDISNQPEGRTQISKLFPVRS